MVVTLVKTVLGGASVQGGGVITLAFSDPVSNEAAQLIVDEVDNFFTEMAAGLDNNVTFQVQGAPARYASSTGELQQIFPSSGGALITGGVSGTAAPRASQALIRWDTEDIVNGRLVRGRTFLPGIPGAVLTDAGNVSSDFQAQITAEATEFLTAVGDTMVVWHRPVAGAGGSEHLVTAASVWSQFAVLTSRRD